MKYWVQKILSILSLGLITSLALPVAAAERVSFWYGALQVTLAVSSIDGFIKEGKIANDLSFYTQYLKPNEVEIWRGFLQTRLDISPVIVSQFTYSPIGEKILIRLGEVFQTEPHLNGYHALRSALILSAADREEGLTILNILHRFPSRNLRLDVGRGLDIASNAAELIQKKGAVVNAIQKISEKEASTSPQFPRNDLRQKGTFKWQKQTFNFNDRDRNRILTTDLYLPQSNQPLSVIVISHGIGENRESFAYLAQHLASHGFAVAALEHPGSDAKKFRQYFAGLSTSSDPMELINQPLDIKFLLDELQRLDQRSALKGKLNTQQVGLIGHSQGGYAVLGLAGAKLDLPNLQKDCLGNESLNLALFVQCEAVSLPQMNYVLQDQRIKAAIAINPLSSSIFGQAGMSQIQVPLMMVASSEDIFTPIVPEQVRPFTWLTQPFKYLVMIENGTHFSVLQPTKNDLKLPISENLIGPNPEIARSYINALSLGFFQTHLKQDSAYASYLSAVYVRSLSQTSLSLNFVKLFTLDDLALALK